ncbi:MAG: hypothetical protein JWQ90_2375 [Hydrocarboniphaga sp.]|uniref:Zn-ribbon domain-containing OB-fold protein n=1 Tax=Hydrocarboniphaga sp. TaxID=2033016 RepID=UPI002621ED2C|nr:OB-fold domain-containing protein [Hydrocarboniphaga sp.]MDB5969925.1 hypothetical protein [Hydrocarboniphaga sp.]
MSVTLSIAVPGDHIAISTNPATEPFWQAARERRLTACQCGSCGAFRMPPTPFCPKCQSKQLQWPTLPGTATIYSYVVCTRSPYPDVADFVYVPIVVDLDGAPGTRLVSNLVGVDPATVAIGQRVQVEWNPIQDGWLLPVFRLAD